MLPFDSQRLLLSQQHPSAGSAAMQYSAFPMLSREQQQIHQHWLRQQWNQQALVAPTAFLPLSQPLNGHLTGPTRSEILQLLLRRDQEEQAMKRRYHELVLLEDLKKQPQGSRDKPDLSSLNELAAATKLAEELPVTSVEKEASITSSALHKETPASEQDLATTSLPANVPVRKEQKGKKKDTKWLATLEQLKDYKKVHGDCIVPRGYSHNPRLASWVAEQRKQYKLLQDGKQSSITPERIALLEDLDFAWNAQEAAWGRHMTDLKKFREQTGHCHVPLNHPDFPKLGLWVKEQRRHYTLLKQGKPSHMTQDRADELDKLGFVWDTHEQVWTLRFRELAKFKESHGHCIVPTNYCRKKLSTWVHHQRRQYKKAKEGLPCHITEERIKALESLGFVWFPRDQKGTSSCGDDCSASGSESDIGSLDLRPLKRQRSS